MAQANGSYTTTCGAMQRTDVSTTFAVLSSNDDDYCGDDADDDGDGDTNWLLAERAPVLHTEFQIGFSIEPNSSDRATSLHTSPSLLDHCK